MGLTRLVPSKEGRVAQTYPALVAKQSCLPWTDDWVKPSALQLEAPKGPLSP